MAILRSIAIHSKKGIKDCIDYVNDSEKASLNANGFDNGRVSADVSAALNYAENAEKTVFELDGDKDLLVSGWQCDKDNAAKEFAELKRTYEEQLKLQGIDPKSRITGKKRNKDGEYVDKEAREAYHFIMSFSARPDLSPQLVHHIGLEFCEKAFADTKAVVSTHMNTDHLHNHFVVSAYNMSSATKYRDTMEKLNNMRQLSDELSLKYGLDIIISNNLSDKRGHSYAENLAREKGESWKEYLKQDIRRASEISSSWQEFKQVMTESGYGINEKPKSVTYYFLGDESKRVRDNKLGTAYMRASIMGLFGQEYEEDKDLADISLKKVDTEEKLLILRKREEEERKEKREREQTLFIPRYTVTGRRRSDLELMFIGAMKLIRHYGDKYEDKEMAEQFKGNPVYAPAEIKLKNMHESLKASLWLGVRDMGHLKELRDKCGAEGSHLKKDVISLKDNLEAAVTVNLKIWQLLELQESVRDKGLDRISLHPVTFTKDEVRANRAHLMPMASRQRRELFTHLDNSGYRVSAKYDDISSKECSKILSFLAGRREEKPEILMTDDEYKAYNLEKYYARIEEGMADRNEGTEEKAVYRDNEVKNHEFDKEIENLSDEDKELMYRYRSLTSELASYGYSVDDAAAVSAESSALSAQFNEMETRIKELDRQYRNLSRLEYNVNLSQNRAYTNGPKYALDTDKTDEIKIKETQEKDKETQKDDKDKADGFFTYDTNIDRDEYFTVLDDYFG